MKLNTIKKPVKKLVVPLLTDEQQRQMRYLSNGCWSFIDRFGDLSEERFEKCRESIRYRYEEADPSQYLISYHPTKEISLATFLKRFNNWFGIENDFIDRGDHVLLKFVGNYWTKHVFLFEIFTLLCRSFHEMKNVNVHSLDSWAKNALKCGEYFTEDTIAIIVNHQKIVKSIGIDDLNWDICENDGFMNYTYKDNDHCEDLFYRLKSKLSTKKLIEAL